MPEQRKISSSLVKQGMRQTHKAGLNIEGRRVVAFGRDEGRNVNRGVDEWLNRGLAGACVAHVSCWREVR